LLGLILTSPSEAREEFQFKRGKAFITQTITDYRHGGFVAETKLLMNLGRKDRKIKGFKNRCYEKKECEDILDSQRKHLEPSIKNLAIKFNPIGEKE
jgi:hypothetical protein